MPEFQASYPSPSVEPPSLNESQLQPQATQSVLKKPWLNLVIFSILNAILFTVALTIIDTTLFFLLPSLVFFAGIFTIVHLVSLTLSILLATFGFYFIHRKRRVTIPRIAVVVVIGVFAYGGLVLPQYIAQMQQKVANPVQTGTKQFNFSDDTIINSRKSAKNTLAISDNAVIWVEQTKQVPPYNNNAWDLFLFTFDKDSGRGETVQLTDTDKAVHKSPDTAIIDGDAVYWTVDAKLYKYTISTRKQEVIREETAGIYGVNGDIALVSGLDEGEYGGVSAYGVPVKGYYLVDLSTDTVIKDLSQYQNGSGFTGTVGSNVYCPYDYDTGVVDIISLAVNPEVTEAQLPYSLQYSNNIVTCSADSVVFTSSQGGLRMYDTKTTKITAIESSVLEAQGKMLDGAFYFTGNRGRELLKYDPQTGEVKKIAVLPAGNWNGQQKYWDIYQGYMVYLEQTSEYESDIHLKSLPETE